MSALSEDEDLPAPPPEGPGLFGDAPPAPASQAAAPGAASPYRVLARKYRPTTFDDMIGQEALVRILRNAFATGRVAHAFMLTGVRGVGKTTTARIIARALNCVGPDGKGGPTADPCGVCPNCVAILADRHPDVVEMDAASRTGVDDVREIIEATRFRPMQARTKVFIVDEVHMLSRNAFNALLKTLEEPPPHVKFVFATTELRKVPVTVLSRCQRFDLRRVSVAELAAHFGRIAEREGVPIAREALEMVARAADGSVRDGLSLLDQAIAQGVVEPAAETGGEAGTITAAAVADMLGLADRAVVFDLFEAVMAGKPADALAVTARAHECGADLGLLLGDLLELTHTLTRLRTVPALRDSPELPEAERTRGAALADTLSIPVLGRAWQMLLKGVAEVEAAPDRRAAAEMVLIRLCYVADMPTPGDLVRRLGNGAAQAGAMPAGASPAGAGAMRGSGGPSGFVEGPAAGMQAVPGGGASLALAGGVTAMTGAGGSSFAASMGGEARAVANGGTVLAAPLPPPAPRLASFRDVAMLVAEQKEAVLHGHLLHSVHLVRFAPPVIELRPQPEAPRDLASRLAALLHRVTGTRWTIALSTAPGEKTLAEQGNDADAARREAAARHPLVCAIMAAFPGATLDAVHDSTVDFYGLAPEAADIALGEPDMPEFAPPDAEPADFMEDL